MRKIDIPFLKDIVKEIETDHLLMNLEGATKAAERIFGLLAGTNEGDDNVHQILQDVAYYAYESASNLVLYHAKVWNDYVDNTG